jgi:MYXO-CTERM domain-containing protein
MKIGFVAFLGTAAVATVANADFIGWTANVRNVSGGYLINVFAVTDNSTDVILNVYGGTPGTPGAGFITTNSAGGFKQGAGAQGVWAPSGSQNWTTLDSFLTVGGSFNTITNAFTGNGSTAGDPPWNVTYTDSDTGEATTVNAFNTASNESGFTNPYLNSVPATGGFFIAGTSSPARSLATLTNRVASSSAAAAAASFGMMVAQLYVTDLDLAWKMGATLRRSNSTTSQGTFEFTIPVPAPGAIALLGVAGLTAGRRRRA